MITLGILAMLGLSITYFGMMYSSEVESELTNQE